MKNEDFEEAETVSEKWRTAETLQSPIEQSIEAHRIKQVTIIEIEED